MGKSKKILIAIILLALFPRLVVLTNSSLTFYSDDAIYASLARFFFEGDLQKAFHPTWQPLYPALSAFFYIFLGNWEDTLRLVSICAGVAIIIPLFFLVKRLLSTTHALFFVASITFFTPLIKLSLFPMSDMLATLFVISGITLTASGLKAKSVKPFILSSFFFGLGFLTRSEGVMFFLLTIGWITLFFFFPVIRQKVQTAFICKDLNLQDQPMPKSVVKPYLLLSTMIATFILTTSPYLIATNLQLNTWTITHKSSAQIKQGHAFQIRNGTTWSQEVVSVKSPNYQSEYFKGGFTYMLEHSSSFIWRFEEKLKIWLKVFDANFPVMTIGALSFIYKKDFWSIGYLLFIMVTAIPITIFVTPLVDIRYLLWSFPLFLLFFYLGAQVILSIVQRITSLRKQDSIAFFPFVISLFFSSFGLSSISNTAIYGQDFTRIHYKPEILAAGDWIKNHTEKNNPRIMIRHEGVEFYADAETIYLPQDLSLDETIEYARRNNVDYIIAWSDELAAEKNLDVLLQYIMNPALKESYRTTQDSRTLVIYVLRD